MSAQPQTQVGIGIIGSDLQAARRAIFQAMRPMVEGIRRTFGSGCEVVLHDFSDPEHSIIAIAGSVTGRKIGGSVTQIGLSLIAQGDRARNQVGYITKTRNGRILRSSTFLLRDPENHVLGALCINIDVSDYQAAARRLLEVAGPGTLMPMDVNFSDDIHQVLRAVLEQEERAMGRALSKRSKPDRLRLIAVLKRRGFFAVQRAVPLVAEYLGLSRASVYNYLEEIRPGGGDADGAGWELAERDPAIDPDDPELHVPEMSGGDIDHD